MTCNCEIKPWLEFRVPGCAWIKYRRCATEEEARAAAQKLQWRLGPRCNYEYQWVVS